MNLKTTKHAEYRFCTRFKHLHELREFVDENQYRQFINQQKNKEFRSIVESLMNETILNNEEIELVYSGNLGGQYEKKDEIYNYYLNMKYMATLIVDSKDNAVVTVYTIDFNSGEDGEALDRDHVKMYLKHLKKNEKDYQKVCDKVDKKIEDMTNEHKLISGEIEKLEEMIRLKRKQEDALHDMIQFENYSKIKAQMKVNSVAYKLIYSHPASEMLAK